MIKIFISTDKLQNDINIIKHKEATISLSFLEIGQILLKDKKDGIWKGKYSSFEVYISDNFSFSVSRAYKFIRIAENFKDFESKEVIKRLGIEKLYELSFIKESEYREVISAVEMGKEVPSISEIKEKTKRFKVKGAPKVQTFEEFDETFLMLKRQGNCWLDRLEVFREDYVRTWKELKEKLISWDGEAKEFKELESIRESISNQIKKLDEEIKKM